MRTTIYHRTLAIAGILFAVLLVVAFMLTSNQVDENASVGSAFVYWTDHKTVEIVSALLLHVASVALVLFGAGLRSRLREGEGEDSTYSVVAFGGAVFAAVGFVIAAWVGLAAATAADQGSREAVYTLNQLVAMDWVPFTAGISVMLIAAGLGGLRTLTLPRVPSWIALVAGVVALTPFGWGGFVVLPFWVAWVSAILFRGQPQSSSAVAATGSPA